MFCFGTPFLKMILNESDIKRIIQNNIGTEINLK